MVLLLEGGYHAAPARSLRAERERALSDDGYKRLLEDHKRLQDQVRLLQRLLHLCGAPDAFEAVFGGVLDAAMEFFSAHSGALYMLDGEEGKLYFATARGPKAQEVMALDILIEPGQGIAGACFQNNEVIAVSDAHKDPRFAKQVSEAVGYEVRSMLTAPIVCDGEPLGVLQVINKQGQPTFSADEVELIRQLGRYAGGIIGLGLELEDLQARAGAADVEQPSREV